MVSPIPSHQSARRQRARYIPIPIHPFEQQRSYAAIAICSSKLVNKQRVTDYDGYRFPQHELPANIPGRRMPLGAAIDGAPQHTDTKV